ncbi:hypothetical protein [Brevundimonas sp. TWP2-3-4b2]|uniref:hypothetical protein n=1 Tax=Brevundimonas sp. TWP2-3-4b2 TaxID=2804595 RepID=UPI003CEFC7BE
MNALSALAAVFVFAAAPAHAHGQVQTWQPQPRPGAPAFDPNRYQADQHRYEMDRLRAQADQREAFTRQTETETRLNRLRIESARPPEPLQPVPYRALRSPEEEQALRLSAGDRRRATSAGVGQIDAWLDRPAR